MTPLERWKMAFGFAVLGALIGLAVTFVVLDVKHREITGLMEIVVALTSLGTMFGQWCYAQAKEKPPAGG